jgi:hypothetical protein
VRVLNASEIAPRVGGMVGGLDEFTRAMMRRELTGVWFLREPKRCREEPFGTFGETPGL